MTDWEELLAQACARADAVVSKSVTPAKRRRVVGTGAAGDRTLAADRDAEREILRALRAAGPLRILSEEIGRTGDTDARYIAIIDPLDGSSNFSRGIPFYCTSIGVAEGETLGGMRYAMVRDLVTGDVYYAEKGRGATKNGKEIGTSTTVDLAQSVAGIDLSRATVRTLRGLVPLLSSVKRQVHFGANALELCLLAEGKVEAFVDVRSRMRITDFAAAYLIAQEAGAVFSGAEGERLDPTIALGPRFSFVGSANEAIHSAILERLRSGTT